MLLVFVDACRNDPRLTRGGGRGRSLARIADLTAESLFVGLSTRPGDVADDGDAGVGSPFARAFAAHMPTPGMRLDDAFREVRRTVIDATAGAQRPEARDDLLSPLVVVNADPNGGPLGDREAIFWSSIKDSANDADFLSYLYQYPDGFFVPLATNRLSELCQGGLIASVRNGAVPAAVQRCLKPGDVFRDLEGGLEMVVVSEAAGSSWASSSSIGSGVSSAESMTPATGWLGTPSVVGISQGASAMTNHSQARGGSNAAGRTNGSAHGESSMHAVTTGEAWGKPLRAASIGPLQSGVPKLMGGRRPPAHRRASSPSTRTYRALSTARTTSSILQRRRCAT